MPTRTSHARISSKVNVVDMLAVITQALNERAVVIIRNGKKAWRVKGWNNPRMWCSEALRHFSYTNSVGVEAGDEKRTFRTAEFRAALRISAALSI
jgi:hypothetical protein